MVIPSFSTTHIGSVPHSDAVELTARLADTLDIPAWLQLPRRTFHENIYTQYATTLPGAVIDVEKERAVIHTEGEEFHLQLETFYQSIIDDNVDAFSLKPENALGFFIFLDQQQSKPARWVKGQLMGAISLGLTMTDQNMRAILYNEMLADILVKNLCMNARWQIRQLRPLSKKQSYSSMNLTWRPMVQHTSASARTNL